MKLPRSRLAVFLLISSTIIAGPSFAGTFRAGAAKVDITPTTFPVIVNGGFLSKKADRANDPLHVRWLVLDDGQTRLALGVMDTCLIPAEFADAVKARAAAEVGIPAERIMLSATHTHSAPSLMRCLGTDPDPVYPDFALPLVVEGLRRAVDRLAPARVGWTVALAPSHTHNRVWIRRPDRMIADPFGLLTVRANMHPGYESPDAIGPSGPTDPELTLLAVQSADGSPMAALANFSMHYFGAPAVSADYFGLFNEKLGALIGAPESFVGIMSQGTSGDLHWMDYSQPKSSLTMESYATGLAGIAASAYKTVTFHDWQPLAMREKTLQIPTRQPDEKRLAWAQNLVAKMDGRPPKDRSEVYAREQLWLKENPARNVKLQAVRVGDFGIAIWPCEVFALSGLKIKAQSPLQPVMNIELANAEEGYIPPPELYPLGGYNTWPCRSAGLAVDAEPAIVSALLGLLEEVSEKSRREVAVPHGDYAQAVIAAKPLAYWRLEEWGGETALDCMPSKRHASYEAGIARWLDGPSSPAFSGQGVINRCAHFAGGRLRAKAGDLGETYSIELWLWNGLPSNVRPITGYFVSRGQPGNRDAPGDHLYIGGSHGADRAGRLVFCTGNGSSQLLVGQSTLGSRQWHHVALVRDRQKAAIYLDGKLEASGEMDRTLPQGEVPLFIGGRCDGFANFEGRLDEIALYARALTAGEILTHCEAGALVRPVGSSGVPTQK